MLTPPPRLRPISDTALADASSGPHRLLFISNGYGEDSIAAEIIRRLPAGVIAEAYPTIGNGLAFAHICPVVGPRAQLASEGWRNVKGSLWRDLATGGLGTLVPGLRFARRIRDHYDRIVVVGDMVGVVGSFISGIRGITYLDVYKTGYGRGYSAIDRWLIRRTAKTCFCRSQTLARSLSDDGIDARFVGNVMMDTIPFGNYDLAARRTHPQAVTLLPGSRQLTMESFGLQVAALRQLPPEKRPDIFLAVAGSVAVEALARGSGLQMRGPMTGEAGDFGSLSDQDMTIHLSRGVTGNLLAAADVVLSQAGTATIQALGLGKPVITFINTRDRSSRVRDENALFGEARMTVPPTPEAIAMALERLLADPAERLRLGEIGKSRIGGSGAIHAIIESILV
jgi:uncharacterized protein (TIGR03492 family)